MAKHSQDTKHEPTPEKVQTTLGVEWQTRTPKEPPMDYVPMGEDLKDSNLKNDN